MVEITWQLMMGVGLAASAGLRAFLPLLVVGAAGRFEVIPLLPSFEWLGSTPALTVLAVAVVIEMLGDKIPVVDHALDVTGTLARPVAGAIAAASPLTALDPITAAVVGIVMGGSVAAGVHTAKAGLRILSTGGTAGLATPVISFTEDAVSFSAAVMSLFIPVVTFTVVVGVLYFLIRGVRRRSSARGSARA